MKRLALSMLLLMSAASAADLRIYPNFAEVRAPVQARNGVVTVTFGQSATNFLVPGSLDVEGVAFESALSQVTPAWLKTQEGKKIFLKSGDTAGKVTFEPVTLIRAEDLLIKDAQGRYRAVTFEQLAFTDLPPRNPQSPQVQYAYRVGAGTPTLSYLTRGVSWGPRYTLRADATGASLTGLADLRNATEDELSADKGAELFAGEVNLQEGRPVPYALESRAAADVAVPAAPAPKIGSLGELRGLQRYQLSDAFSLPPQSTLTVPFLRPKIGFERYAALNIPFTPQGSDGKLSRAYRVKADVFLPGGPVTVRDEGRIVGQANVDDTPPGEAVDLFLGADPDLSYTRAVQVLRSDKTGASYRVTLTLENAKARPVRAEVSEVFGGNATLDGQATRTNDGLQFKVDVPAGGKVTRSYTVSFKYGG